MSPPRVIVHAGFHKTGTTSAQKFLRANGKHIYPRCALVLPGRLRKSVSKYAVGYSRFGTELMLNEFARSLRKILTAIERRDRAVLITDENLAGRMLGREGHAGYGATPPLMARMERVIHEVFGEDADITFYFSTRAPQDWLLSTYKHNLRTSRLDMDAASYLATHANAANLNEAAATVAKAVTGKVHTADLADLNGPNGPAQALIDLIELPQHLRKRLTPHPVLNTGPADDMMDDLLALNRSALSDDAVADAKAALLGKAKT